jgi:hypothetical protein
MNGHLKDIRGRKMDDNPFLEDGAPALLSGVYYITVYHIGRVRPSDSHDSGRDPERYHNRLVLNPPEGCLVYRSRRTGHAAVAVRDDTLTDTLDRPPVEAPASSNGQHVEL